MKPLDLPVLDEIAVLVEKKVLGYWGRSEERKGWGVGGGAEAGQ